MPMPQAPGLGACVRCGLEVAATDGMHGVRTLGAVRHFICEPSLRSGVTRRIEAVRTLHRACTALGHLPAAKAHLEMQLAQLPDVTDVGEVLELLSRVRVAVECTPGLATEQRRLALSYLDSVARKLA